MKCIYCNVVGLDQKQVDLAAEIAPEQGTLCLECARSIAGGNWHKYIISTGDGGELRLDEVQVSSMEEAKDAAIDWIQDGAWDCKMMLDVWITKVDHDGKVLDRVDFVVEVGKDPEPPECAEGLEHDWCSPYEVVGGLKENPGVWSLGGTTIHTSEVCSHCGWFKKRTVYGSQRNPGQCDHVEYEEPSDSSLEWVQS